jgi:hypothetical protein
MEIKDKIQKLTPQEIQELDVAAAERVLLNNSNLLIDIGNALFEASQIAGEAKIKEAQLKYYKDVVVEQNRALSKVIQNG